jgi:hypothetical protein
MELKRNQVIMRDLKITQTAGKKIQQARENKIEQTK